MTNLADDSVAPWSSTSRGRSTRAAPRWRRHPRLRRARHLAVSAGTFVLTAGRSVVELDAAGGHLGDLQLRAGPVRDARRVGLGLGQAAQSQCCPVCPFIFGQSGRRPREAAYEAGGRTKVIREHPPPSGPARRYAPRAATRVRACTERNTESALRVWCPKSTGRPAPSQAVELARWLGKAIEDGKVGGPPGSACAPTLTLEAERRARTFGLYRRGCSGRASAYGSLSVRLNTRSAPRRRCRR